MVISGFLGRLRESWGELEGVLGGSGEVLGGSWRCLWVVLGAFGALLAPRPKKRWVPHVFWPLFERVLASILEGFLHSFTWECH